MTKYKPPCPKCGGDTKYFRGEFYCQLCDWAFEWKPMTKDTGEFLRRVDDWLMGGS